MKLYDYYRSTASYRVRITLNLKNITYESIPLDLLHGKQRDPNYLKLNPQGLVPTIIEDQFHLSQSLAIIEYLDANYPDPKLIPKDTKQAAAVRSFAYVIACEMHPLNNLRVLKYLENTLAVDEPSKLTWYHHWLTLGFNTLEQRLEKKAISKNFCFGEQVTLADVCLIPQIFNAHRFKFDMSAYPKLMAINEHCLNLSAFQRAQPSQKVN